MAVLVLGDPILHATIGPRACRVEATTGWLSGPHDRPSLNEPRGRTHAYGIVATPVGVARLFGLDPRCLRGRVVPLEAWSAGPALRQELIGLEPSAGLEHVRARLAAGAHPSPPRVERAEQVLAALEGDPRLPVAELARELGVSHAHLDREFARVVGLSPRRVAAILRVRRLLAELDPFADVDWAARAAAHGWYDQSHLIRDFKRYTNVTPAAYLAAQRAHYSPDETPDAAGFVPIGPGGRIKSVQAADGGAVRS